MTLADWGTIAAITSAACAGLVWLGRSIVAGVRNTVGDALRPELQSLRDDLNTHTRYEEQRFGKIEVSLALLAGHQGVDLREGAP